MSYNGVLVLRETIIAACTSSRQSPCRFRARAGDHRQSVDEQPVALLDAAAKQGAATDCAEGRWMAGVALPFPAAGRLPPAY